MAAPGEEVEDLRRAVAAGAECLVLGLMLAPWPTGLTCEVDAEGRIAGLDGPQAPHHWVGDRLPTATMAQAKARLVR
ncbi:hypothetical protein GCM10023259_078550 [Thermocatellispora tengchongensis]